MIVWVDIETTGLRPHEDLILEFAAVVTDDELNEIWSIEAVTHAHYEFIASRVEADAFVLNMHRQSGLLREIQSREHVGGIGVAGAAMRLYDYLSTEFSSTTLRGTPLGGSSVHFDRNFLDANSMPGFNLLSHRHLDVSALNEFAKRFAPEAYESRPQAEPRHRAMPDVRFSIELAKHYRRRFGRTPL